MCHAGKMRANAALDPDNAQGQDERPEPFGLELGDADHLLFDQFEETWAADESLAARARNNDF